MADEPRKNRGLGFVSGLILGGMAGAAAAALYARRAQIPSVETIRERGTAVAREAAALAGRAAESLDELNDRTRPLLEKTQHACAEVVQDGRERVARAVAGLQRRRQEPRSEAA